MDDGLSASEWDQFTGLLQRFADNDLDQHEAWRLDTRYGPVFVRVSRELPPDEIAGAYRPVSTPPGYASGRSAHVTSLDRVASRSDVQRVIAEMRADLADTGAREWENPTLESFLGALEGFLRDIPGYFANRGEPVPAQPDWALFARILVAATGYE
jgi:hypothetical protein